MPEFAIVDAHVHLYDPDVVRYGWMRGKPALAGPHGLAELDAARGAVEVRGVVWIEVGADPGQHQGEARWIARLADADPRIEGMVAHAPLERGAAAATEIERLLEHGKLRGIRRLLQDEPDDAFCLRPAFIEGVRLLARHDLSFDICVYHRQLAGALELARRCPEVRFVLDHIGKPGIRDGLMAPWRTRITELAALPNVWCKISGPDHRGRPTTGRAQQLRPYLDHALESFRLRPGDVRQRLAGLGADPPVPRLGRDRGPGARRRVRGRAPPPVSRQRHRVLPARCRREGAGRPAGYGALRAEPARRTSTPRSCDLPASAPPALITVVDTEEAFDWSAPFDAASRNVGHMASIHRVQDLFDELGVVPCYLVSYPIVAQAAGFRTPRALCRSRPGDRRGASEPLGHAAAPRAAATP